MLIERSRLESALRLRADNNRTYYTRSRRGGMVSARAILEDIAERAADRRRAKKRSGKVQGQQLELFPARPVTEVEPPSADRPLGDLFPEFYA